MFNIFRNKEFKIWMLISLSITLIGSIVSVIINPIALIITLTTGILINLAFTIFTIWRYREIEKLSAYLNKICRGDYCFDIRDNREGELSILKNDIYKVTNMLSEKSKILESERINLSNAMSDISHQLKTPLTSMTLMADLLSKHDISDEKRAEFTENIKNALKRIEWLVTSLLKISKIDAGTVTFNNDKVIVKDIVQKALEPLAIPIDIKCHILNIDGDMNASFIGDFNWSVEALINIIKNCVEHTDVGGTIDISYGENPIFTEIIVKDNGKGIDKGDIPYIFKRFYKGKNSSDDSVGIGLAMAKTIISNQGGDVTVSSKVGKGSQFIIKFYKGVI